jgi:hypothetical protein
MAKRSAEERLELLQGPLDMLILRTLQWGPRHGHGIGQSIRAQSDDLLTVETGLAVGSGFGLVIGLLAARVLGSIVYEATPRDPIVLGSVILVMAALGVATWIPAHRALAISPLRLLRED